MPKNWRAASRICSSTSATPRSRANLSMPVRAIGRTNSGILASLASAPAVHRTWLVSPLLASSFLLEVPATLTGAFVLDGFALFVKRVLLATALVSLAGTYPYVRARGVADRLRNLP